jgi:ketosteroid isomerase-like protein
MDVQENTRLVQQAYEKFGAGDVEGFVNSLDSEIEWIVPAMESVPFAGTWRGREGVKKFLRKLAETQEVVEFTPEQFVAQGNTVIVLGRFVMRVKATNRESASDWAHVWTIAAGKIAHFREYVDTAAVSHAHHTASRSRQATLSS